MEIHETNSNKIKASIIIPTFNRQASLLETLDSLFNQTFPRENFEIIVVDDGSTDETEKVMIEMEKNHFNLRYLRQENKGAASARNLGILNANGEIIGFTDDDCTVNSTWIISAVESFERNEISGVQGITLPEREIKLRNKIFAIADMPFINFDEYNPYPTCNIFYKRKNLIEISGFDEKLGSYSEDTDLAIRIMKQGNIIHLNKNMIVYHETRYLNLLTFIFKRLKRLESVPLFVKKNPEFRKRLFLGIFYQKNHIYPFFLLITTLLYIYKVNVLIPALFTILFYLYSRVITDRDYKMMPLRIFFFWRYFLLDFASIYYLLIGSIKYKCILI
jgi:glycosyltransferase involved in cell wall biosynthesis